MHNRNSLHQVTPAFTFICSIVSPDKGFINLLNLFLLNITFNMDKNKAYHFKNREVQAFIRRIMHLNSSVALNSLDSP